MRSPTIPQTHRVQVRQYLSFSEQRGVADKLSLRVPLYARAPTRIDLAGGWTDLIPFARENEGLVVNVAIGVYVYVSLTPVTDQLVSLYAVDLKQLFHPSKVSTSLHGLSLPQAVLTRVRPNKGCHLVTWSDAPKGGGLGASGALGVALIGLLSIFAGGNLDSRQLIDKANAVERETGIPCGKQDHYASLVGGADSLRCQDESILATPLQLPKEVTKELQNSLLLVYTGESHFSGKILQNVVDAYKAGNRGTHGALTALRQVAEAMKETLEAGDLSSLGHLLSENWRFQKRLHPCVNTKRIDELFEIARKSGCIGGKACGAGGGGCLVFHCEPDRIGFLAQALSEAGARVIPFGLDFNGFCVWSPPWTHEPQATRRADSFDPIPNLR